MKRALLFIAFTLLLVDYSFCNQPMRELQNLAEELTAMCPLDLGMTGLISGVRVEQDAMVMEIAVGENNPINFSVLRNNMSLYKKSVLIGFAKPATIPFLTVLVNANAKLVVQLVKKSTGETFRAVFSQYEIKDVVEGRIKEATGRESLALMALNANIMCPMTVDASTVLQSVTLDGNYFVYTYTVDENQVQIQALRDNYNSMRVYLVNQLQTDDPAIVLLKNACHEARMGISYSYVGDSSGDKCIFNIEHYEF